MPFKPYFLKEDLAAGLARDYVWIYQFIHYGLRSKSSLRHLTLLFFMEISHWSNRLSTRREEGSTTLCAGCHFLLLSFPLLLPGRWHWTDIFSRRDPPAGKNEMTFLMYGDLSYRTCLYEYSWNNDYIGNRRAFLSTTIALRYNRSYYIFTVTQTGSCGFLTPVVRHSVSDCFYIKFLLGVVHLGAQAGLSLIFIDSLLNSS